MGKLTDLTGRRFERLVVIKRIGTKYNHTPLWLCKCDCGNYTEVTSCNLRGGVTRSCGCLRYDCLINRVVKHGISHTRLDRIYNDMKQRCYNEKRQNYKYYGGRGIIVCDEWRYDSSEFFDWALENGYSDELSIDRIDVNGDYCPENCRWVDIQTQACNKSNSCYVTIKGITKNISQWEKESGISHKVIKYRLEHGWTEEELLLPPRQNRTKRIQNDK